MRIERVSIRNYKAFDALDLSFRDGGASAPFDLVALTGINGSGKSSVLSAIMLGAGSINPCQVPEESVRRSDAPAQIEVHVAFTTDELTDALGSRVSESKEDSVLSLVSTSAHPGVGVSRSGTGVFARGQFLGLNWYPLGVSDPTAWRVVYLPHDRSVPLRRVQQVERIVLPEPSWDRIGGDLKQYLVNLDFVRMKRVERGGPDPFEPYRALTRRLFRGKALDHVTEDFRVVFRTDDGLLVDFDDLSSGERAVLALVGSMIRADFRRSVYLIDEPEQHLHPRWQAELPGLFKELATTLECQFIMATHSVEIAEATQAHGGAVFDLSPVAALPESRA